MKNEISVVSLDKRFEKNKRGIQDAAQFFLETLSKNKTRVEVFLVNDRRMRAINQKHRGKSSPTNVLAFEAPGDFPNADNELLELGEIYLSPSYIKKHDEDINYMLLHGILHLLGFNHENKSDRIKMEKVEDKFRKWLNSKS